MRAYSRTPHDHRVVHGQTADRNLSVAAALDIEGGPPRLVPVADSRSCRDGTHRQARDGSAAVGSNGHAGHGSLARIDPRAHKG